MSLETATHLLQLFGVAACCKGAAVSEPRAHSFHPLHRRGRDDWIAGRLPTSPDRNYLQGYQQERTDCAGHVLALKHQALRAPKPRGKK